MNHLFASTKGPCSIPATPSHVVDDDQESAVKAAAGGRFSRKLSETESESGPFLVTADVECCPCRNVQYVRPLYDQQSWKITLTDCHTFNFAFSKGSSSQIIPRVWFPRAIPPRIFQGFWSCGVRPWELSAIKTEAFSSPLTAGNGECRHTGQRGHFCSHCDLEGQMSAYPWIE